ncbi:vgr related protein [Luteolibacter algae]|uniref:Vgr related protein n=1 Tax=Luteolibacter algae TaxID=454151 RepID=A0ABW5DB54_9BACT
MKHWKSRPLTAGEIHIGQEIFSDKIDWRQIRILREKAVFFQSPEVTMAPDGNIWFHPEGRLARSEDIDDFSKSNLRIRAHLIHELTHVYQFQHGINLVLEKVLLFFKHGPLGGYNYTRTADEKFSSYNIEQQACILADHYTFCEENGLSMEIEMSLGE